MKPTSEADALLPAIDWPIAHGGVAAGKIESPGWPFQTDPAVEVA